jgi:MFS family permease
MVVRAIALSVLTDPGLMASTMLLHGAGVALLTVGGVSYVSRHAPAGTAATAQGVLTATVFGLAMIVGPAISGLLAGAFPLPEVFGIASVGSISAVGALTLALSASLRGATGGPALGPSPDPGPGTLPGR